MHVPRYIYIYIYIHIHTTIYPTNTHIYPIHSCGELSVEDLSALKYLHTGDPAAAAAAKASALETSFGKWVLYCFIGI